MLELPPDEVHIHVADLAVSPEEIEGFAAILSPDETTRANRYHFDRDRRRFIVARGNLRRLLGEYLGVKPEKIVFTYSDRGKPSVEASIEFNVSHSGEIALFGFSSNRRIGVDVERIREVKDLDGLTERFFCARENERIRNRSNKEEIFFQLWTAKEAYLKAIGTGIAGGLDAVEVSIEPLKLANVEGEWQIWTCRPEPDYIATVAIEGEGARVKTFGRFRI